MLHPHYNDTTLRALAGWPVVILILMLFGSAALAPMLNHKSKPGIRIG